MPARKGSPGLCELHSEIDQSLSPGRRAHPFPGSRGMWAGLTSWPQGLCLRDPVREHWVLGCLDPRLLRGPWVSLPGSLVSDIS